jgi:CRP/FNR family transcriptional regulator, dissimilatory nitrate respiration regulator
MNAPDWILPALLGAALRRSLAAGETLFLREDRPVGLYLLESGEIRLTRSDQEGREMILCRAQPGDTFAEASLFSETYHCDAAASAPSVVLLVPKAAILEAFASEPEIAQAFMATLARQVMGLRTRLENRNLRTARERVLHHLGLQAGGIDRVLRVNGNLKALAAELGLTHESLYRTLATLEAEGVIKRGQGEIRLTNLSV